MAETVDVKPELIRWAVKRSGLPLDELAARFPKLGDWQSGARQPTLKQLEDFAKKTMTPFGYLFLDTPPVEALHIPDFRTKDDQAPRRPSPNLIETLHDMRRRQNWMREHLIEQGQEALPFVGEVTLPAQVKATAKRIRGALLLEDEWAESCSSWEEALRTLRDAAENIGILIAASGVVGLNNTRHLDPDEFRGFVLCDPYAPLIFVNGNDSKSAQMFTLAHELAHIWLGKDGLFNLVNTMPADDELERLCNRVAAEFLVPADKLRARWPEAEGTANPFRRLANIFKVSPIVAARRARDLGLIDDEKFFSFYHQTQTDWQREREERESTGGNFYATQSVRLSRRFAHAVVQAVREGRLLYLEAYRLTGLKGDTFEKFSNRLIQEMKR
jgi:Zn-dependent peptidase ImmA (M78 family)